MLKLLYAGIGSRQCPQDILDTMTSIGFQMSQSGWHLRSGFADGADKAFGLGAAQQAEISGEERFTMYLPWAGYNGAPLSDPCFLVSYAPDLFAIAKECHPIWDELDQPAKLLLTRNVAIVAGLKADDPVNLVLGWTSGAKRRGGTGHAMRVAEMLGIPVFDLASAYDRKTATEFINSCEEKRGLVNL